MRRDTSNVVNFPRRSVFELLSAGSDGVVVLFSDQTGSANHVIGPFGTAGAALAWATENGACENVTLDHPSFSRWS